MDTLHVLNQFVPKKVFRSMLARILCELDAVTPY